MKRIINSVVFLVVACALSGFGGDCMKQKAGELGDFLRREIKVGDARNRVEDVLRGVGIAYDYDRFQNRYQSTVVDSRCGPYEAVSIYIDIDSSEKVSKIEVFVTYTAP